MSAWLKLEPIDLAFFVVANLIGYLVGTAIPDPTFAAFASILVAYHVFLLCLVLHGEKEAGISLPIGSTLLTHLACLILIVPVGMTRHLPFFGLFRFGVASFAVFERNWLFSATTSVEPKREEAPVAPVVLEATGEDFEAWRQHLSKRKATQRKAGMSVRQEYEQWLHARLRNRGA